MTCGFMFFFNYQSRSNKFILEKDLGIEPVRNHPVRIDTILFERLIMFPVEPPHESLSIMIKIIENN